MKCDECVLLVLKVNKPREYRKGKVHALELQRKGEKTKEQQNDSTRCCVSFHASLVDGGVEYACT
jgi:hypothetical protein